MIKCTQLQCTKIATQTIDSWQFFEWLILQKSPKLISKITQIWDKNTTKVLDHVCPKQDHEYSLDCSPRRQFYLKYYILLYQSFVWYAQPLNNESGKKDWINLRVIFVDMDKIFRIANSTTLYGELSSYQAIFTCAPHSEMWSCVWMGNSRKSTILLQRGHDIWDGHDYSSFQPPYPKNWQESHIILFLCKIFTPDITRENVVELTVIQSVFCSTQFRPCFLYTTLLAFWLGTFFGGWKKYPWTFP